MVLLGLFLLNGFYAFRGTGEALGSYRFMSQILSDAPPSGEALGNRFQDSGLAALPLPFPKDFVAGIDIQLRDFERGRTDKAWGSYWNGDWKLGGWWYFYAVGFLVKEPVALWLLFLTVVALKVLRRRDFLSREDVFLMLPCLLIFGVVSAETGMSRHLRYAFPAFPYLLLFISQSGRLLEGLCRRGSDQSELPFHPTISTKFRWAMAIAWGWFAASSLSSIPHSLTYFNEFAGGYSHGAQWMIGSNFDWGQDLYYLREWQKTHPEKTPLRLAYFGPIDPKWLGTNSNCRPRCLAVASRDRPRCYGNWGRSPDTTPSARQSWRET